MNQFLSGGDREKEMESRKSISTVTTITVLKRVGVSGEMILSGLRHFRGVNNPAVVGQRCDRTVITVTIRRIASLHRDPTERGVRDIRIRCGTSGDSPSQVSNICDSFHLPSKRPQNRTEPWQQPPPRRRDVPLWRELLPVCLTLSHRGRWAQVVHDIDNRPVLLKLLRQSRLRRPANVKMTNVEALMSLIEDDIATKAVFGDRVPRETSPRHISFSLLSRALPGRKTRTPLISAM